jgi:flagellin FlaB
MPFIRNQRGITGLETAIILIAFVIVASVFAYSIISAGLFTDAKVKETVNTGVDQATGSLAISGEMKADGQPATVLTAADAASAWTVSPNVTAATETTDRKEGIGAVRLSIAVGFTSGLIAFENLVAPVDLSSHFAAVTCPPVLGPKIPRVRPVFS